MQSSAATTTNIVQRCSYAHTKFAQQIQFTVGHPADLDSAYFSESGSVKIAYITDIARFTRPATPTKLKCNLQTASLSWTMLVGDHGLLFPRYPFHGCNSSFSRCVVFWETISSNLVTAKWHCAYLPDIFISSQKILV